MLEPWRSHYLDALGVDVYVPRVILPGAKPSDVCEWDWPEDAAAPVSEAPDIPEIVATAPVPMTPTPPAERLPPVTEETRAPRREPSAPAVTPARAAQAAIPRFALGIVSVADSGVLIVDDAPPNNAVRADYLRLLGNLSFALQRRAGNPTLDVFIWPMVKNNPQIDQSEGAAREALAAYLQKQIQQQALQSVLLLGGNAAQWLAESVRPPLGVDIACSVSGWSALRNPAAKRQLWQDLRHLAAKRS